MLLDTIQDVHVDSVPSNDNNDIQSELIGNHFATILQKTIVKLSTKNDVKMLPQEQNCILLLFTGLKGNYSTQYLICMVNQ